MNICNKIIHQIFGSNMSVVFLSLFKSERMHDPWKCMAVMLNLKKYQAQLSHKMTFELKIIKHCKCHCYTRVLCRSQGGLLPLKNTKRKKCPPPEKSRTARDGQPRTPTVLVQRVFNSPGLITSSNRVHSMALKTFTCLPEKHFKQTARRCLLTDKHKQEEDL